MLEYNGLNQRLEIRLAKLDTIIANPFDNGREHRVAGAEVVDGLLHLETLARRSASPLLYRHANTSLSLHLAACLLAQDQLPSIKVDVDMVNILTSVRDKRGALIPNLQKEDFTILEDGKPQTIKYFTKETDLPLTIGLLVDVSGSQRNLIDIERSAASQFFREVLRKKDLAFLISFGEEAELLQDYTGSPRLLTDGLGQLRPSSGVSGIHPGPVPTIGGPRGTVLYDAVYLAANEKLKGEVGRKVIVLITDGVDQGSRLSRNQAIEAAQKSDAVIYSIDYSDPRAYGRVSASAAAAARANCAR